MKKSEKSKGASFADYLMKLITPALSEIKSTIATRKRDGVPMPPPELLELFNQPHWLISGVREFRVFFGALAALVPPGSLLRIEGNPYPDVEECLRPWLREPSQKTGRFWRTLAKYELPVTADNMEKLARLAENHAEPEMASHLIVLHAAEPILHWYDAPCDPIYVACSIDEAAVVRFAQTIDGRLKKEADPAST